MRKMASIRQIDEILPIAGADNIEAARVGGWTVVVGKGAHAPRESILYVEIDAILPKDICPFEVSEKDLKKYGGHLLRTKKIKGVYSQGLIMPIPESVTETDDIDEVLGIKKYEPPLELPTRGQQAGLFPHDIQKTQQERYQNIMPALVVDDGLWVITEKMDGTSMTIFVGEDGDLCVCSRNFLLRCEERSAYFLEAYAVVPGGAKSALGEYLKKTRFCLQGELCGPAIQNNKHKLQSPTFFLFDIYDRNARKKLAPEKVAAIAKDFNIRTVRGLESDILDAKMLRDFVAVEKRSGGDYFMDFQKIQKFGDVAEGYVLKKVGSDLSFKVVLNKNL